HPEAGHQQGHCSHAQALLTETFGSWKQEYPQEEQGAEDQAGGLSCTEVFGHRAILVRAIRLDHHWLWPSGPVAETIYLMPPMALPCPQSGKRGHPCPREEA